MFLQTRDAIGAVPSDAREGVRRLLEVSREGTKLILARTVLLYVGLGALLVGLVARDWIGLVIAAMPSTLIWWMEFALRLRPSSFFWARRLTRRFCDSEMSNVA